MAHIWIDVRLRNPWRGFCSTLGLLKFSAVSEVVQEITIGRLKYQSLAIALL